ncbi:MAG: hypothetical protein K2X37_12760 [Chitinophagaceae bacterium]|nr:hypothetical protein [Chitinophagaceae bacterium]
MQPITTITEKKIYPLFILNAVLLVAGQLLLVREQFLELLVWQIVLHLIFIVLWKNKEQLGMKDIIVAAAVFRLLTAFTMPTLSDDVFRFIWDGQLIVKGENPMLTTPDNYLAAMPPIAGNYVYAMKLHGLINHPQFYTCYPPLMQGAFWLSAFLGGSSITASIIIIKLFISIVDVIGIIFLYKLLKKNNLNQKLIILYALNPIIIIEGAGNAHFEVVQAAFIFISLYYLHVKKMTTAAICWGLAIVTKLVPLMLLPLIVRWLGWKKGIIFSVISVFVAAISFLPFVSSNSLQGFGKSLNLYFQNFEFNGSIYYIAREIGWSIKGYNYISFIGPFLMSLFLGCYAILFFTKKTLTFNSFASASAIVFSLYYLFATTVHPWYFINLIPFAILAGKKYPFVWLAAAFLSYQAYSNHPFHEKMWVIAIEYAIPLFFIGYHLVKKYPHLAIRLRIHDTAT